MAVEVVTAKLVDDGPGGSDDTEPHACCSDETGYSCDVENDPTHRTMRLCFKGGKFCDYVETSE